MATQDATTKMSMTSTHTRITIQAWATRDIGETCAYVWVDKPTRDEGGRWQTGMANPLYVLEADELPGCLHGMRDDEAYPVKVTMIISKRKAPVVKAEEPGEK